MSIQLTMPRLSDTMETGTIIKWNVGVGDEVTAGDVVADIETDKATMEMQVFDDGVIAGLLVDPGNQVPVGTLIAVLAEEGESVADVSLEDRQHLGCTCTQPAAPAAPVAAEAIPADIRVRLPPHFCFDAPGFRIRRADQGQPRRTAHRLRAWHRPGPLEGHRPRRSHHQA